MQACTADCHVTRDRYDTYIILQAGMYIYSTVATVSYIGGILKGDVFQPVLKKGFLLASLADDIQSASITDLACEDRGIDCPAD